MSDPRKTTVNVTLTSVDQASGTGQFDLQPVGNDPLPPPNGPHQVLTFENQNHNGIDIAFVLFDKTNEGYTFPPNSEKTQAVSSKLGAIDLCPPQGTSEVLSPIEVGRTNSDFDTLRVHNPNQKGLAGPFPDLLGPFSYVLWVTNDGGANYVKLDPGGQNQNGSTQKFSWTAAIVTIVVVAAIAAVVLYKLRVFGS